MNLLDHQLARQWAFRNHPSAGVSGWGSTPTTGAKCAVIAHYGPGVERRGTGGSCRSLFLEQSQP